MDRDMAMQDFITQIWARTTGRRIDAEADDWLIGPIGDGKIIGDGYIAELANKEDLKVWKDLPNFGLLEGMEQIGISGDEKNRLNKKVAEFYENTSNYEIDVWSEWKSVFKPFGKLLSVLFSKRLQQLNLPLSTLDTSRGMKSEVLKLKTKGAGETKWTVWYRTLKRTNDVIYSG